MPLPTGAYGAGGLLAYGAQSDRSEGTPPFGPQENYGEVTCEGNPVVFNIDAKIDKGFFWSADRVWTCYRRNYFAVTVSYGLSPWIANGRLYLTRENGVGPEQIQALAVSLAAAVDGTTGKSIELIQHTPKRDKGPQLPMKKEKLPPTPPGKSHEHAYGLNSFHQANSTPGPQLPLQDDPDANSTYSPASHSGSNYQHAFERIQFKSATANNGKRRAQQQYYHLIVELWANVQNPRDKEPQWIKIAAKTSVQVVVRGRSPSHYQNEGPHNATPSRGPGNPPPGGHPHQSYSSNGTGPYAGGTFRNGYSGSGGSAAHGSVYRGGNSYSLDPSPVGSHSVSSASSLSGGPVEGLVGDTHMVNEDDGKLMDGHNDYQYYPATIYEGGMASKVETSALPLPERSIKQEYSGPAAVATNWQVGGCGRYQGVETSRGYYPDVHAHAGY